ncbi:UNVERIFIED_CONTAM: hypothetical protein GTU68_019568 [Idotea baltica]|nr:hypothetical protein [Idotea baltica]
MSTPLAPKNVLTLLTEAPLNPKVIGKNDPKSCSETFASNHVCCNSRPVLSLTHLQNGLAVFEILEMV